VGGRRLANFPSGRGVANVSGGLRTGADCRSVLRTESVTERRVERYRLGEPNDIPVTEWRRLR